MLSHHAPCLALWVLLIYGFWDDASYLVMSKMNEHSFIHLFTKETTLNHYILVLTTIEMLYFGTSCWSKSFGNGNFRYKYCTPSALNSCQTHVQIHPKQKRGVKFPCNGLQNGLKVLRVFHFALKLHSPPHYSMVSLNWLTTTHFPEA